MSQQYEQRGNGADAHIVQLTEVSRAIEGKAYKLPDHIDPKRFKAAALTALTITPSLLQCDRQSLFLALGRAALDGLMPDGRRAALVPYKGKVQYLPMVWGLAELARNSGDVGAVFADIVCENDDFDFCRGSTEHIRHRPPLRGDRGMMIGAFAIVRRKDGTIFDFDSMSLEDIERRRKVSAASNGPWGTPPHAGGMDDRGNVIPYLPHGSQWYDEQAKKTVLKHLFKRCPLSPDLDAALARDNEAEGFTMVAAPEAAPAARPVDKLGAITSGTRPEPIHVAPVRTASVPSRRPSEMSEPPDDVVLPNYEEGGR